MEIFSPAILGTCAIDSPALLQGFSTIRMKLPLHLSLYSSTGFQDMEDTNMQGVLVSYTVN